MARKPPVLPEDSRVADVSLMISGAGFIRCLYQRDENQE
jgi:hypothetical protein